MTGSMLLVMLQLMAFPRLCCNNEIYELHFCQPLRRYTREDAFSTVTTLLKMMFYRKSWVSLTTEGAAALTVIKYF